MPIFLIHGFRWARTPIRHHVILNNVDDAAPDYIMHTTTPDALRASFTEKWPEIMAALPNLYFIEQYDPEDCSPKASDQPYAFVADLVVKSDLNIDVTAVQHQGQGIPAATWVALGELRDQISSGEEIRWYAVYNGDVKRVGNHTYREATDKTSKDGGHKRGIIRRWLSRGSGSSVN